MKTWLPRWLTVPWRARRKRREEAAFATRNHLKPVPNTALWELDVLGKRNKARIVPVGSVAREALRQWRDIRDELAAPGEKALFVSRRGRRDWRRLVLGPQPLVALFVGHCLIDS